MKKYSEFVTSFLNIFQTLTKFQKKIFRYLQWIANKYRHVFVSVPTICEAVFCSLRTVTSATNLFQQLGWISKIKRGYQSNDYYMNDELLALDLNDNSLFLREKLQDNCSVLRDYNSEYIDISTKSAHIPDKKDRPIPEFIKTREVSREDQQRLANTFSEYALKQSMEDAKWYHKQKGGIKSYIALIWSRAKFHATKVFT